MKNNDKLYRIVESMLYNYRKIKIEIKNLELDIEEVSNNYKGVGAISYEERVKTYKISSSVEAEVLSKDEKVQQIIALKRSKEIQVQRVDNMLSILKEDEYKLIELRYFKELQFKEIGDILCKSDIYLIGMRKRIIYERLIPLLGI